MSASKSRVIGILTSGGDCPGLNAAIRAVVKPALAEYGMRVIGFHDGFRGLALNNYTLLDDQAVSGILTLGGTLLGTSRDKPHQISVDGRVQDMTRACFETVQRHDIDCVVCLGGGGTQRNALHLQKAAGINVLTLPKTIDNDVGGTDVTFGFDTALTIASEAIDRLHTTATSHHRIIVCEVMGHESGWLALGAGIAGGADVVLIPEIPYDLALVAENLRRRRESGKRFSIIAVAEGAVSIDEATRASAARDAAPAASNPLAGTTPQTAAYGAQPEDRPYHLVEEPKASRIAREIQRLTGTEARVTSLGHVQRGGSPSPHDRMLCTLLGTKATELLADGVWNVMVAVRGDRCEAVPLEEVAGRKKMVPLDHPWIRAARLVGTCFGDR